MIILALTVATLCIFIRSVFRVVELQEGFSGKLANNQVSFMILDGVMCIIACISLTAMHPGLGFGKEGWAAASYPFLPPDPVRERKRNARIDESGTNSTPEEMVTVNVNEERKE